MAPAAGSTQHSQCHSAGRNDRYESLFSSPKEDQERNESHLTADIPWKQLSKPAGFPNLREGETAVGKQVSASGSLSNFMFNLIKCELSPKEREGEHFPNMVLALCGV